MKQKYRHSLRAKDTNAEKDCELGMKVTMTRLSLLLSASTFARRFCATFFFFFFCFHYLVFHAI